MEIWIFGGGVFCNFGFGLREKVGNLDLGGYSVTSDLDLGKKVGNLDFFGGGYSVKVMEKEKNLLYRKIYLINLE